MIRRALANTTAMLTLFGAITASADDISSYSQQSIPPNLTWVLDNSGSMLNLPCEEFSPACFGTGSADMKLQSLVIGLATVKLCKSTFVTSLGYVASTAYPEFDPDFKGGGEPADFSPTGAWSKSALAQPWKSAGTTVKKYCDTLNDCNQRSRCMYSMNNFGYFWEDGACTGSGDPMAMCGSVTNSPQSVNDVRVTGNFLRFYPPKYVAARKVFKDVISDGGSGTLVRQRMSLMVYDSSNQGGSLISSMNPPCNQLCFDDSCNSNFFSNRAALRNKVDGLAFDARTPLGETLDDVGCYFTQGNGAKCSGAGIKFGGGANNAPVCLPCQRNFAIIITDGLPTSDGAWDKLNPGNKDAFGPFDSGDQPVSGADGKSDIDPTTKARDGSRYGYILPEVSRYLFTKDLDPVMAGTQSVVTYAISFGATDPADPSRCAGVLDRAAAAGGGKCLAARDADALKGAVLSILQEIDTRVRSFSAPAIQSTRAQGEVNANMAVFKPDPTGPLWQGHVYSFQLWDERIQGSRSDIGNTAVTNELFVLDADGKPIAFDQEGNVLARPYWDAALCLGGDIANKYGPLTPADLFNADVTTCYRSADENAGNARRIYTKVLPAVPGALDPFTVANALTLSPFLTGALKAAANVKIIKFLRGFDMLDLAGKGAVDTPIERNLSNLGPTAGWWKLGDIFHSTPALVTTPTEYSGFYGKTSSYASFMTSNAKRSRVLLTGANDGMIHAFDAGKATVVDGVTSYDHGTGAELWAMLPNHLLPSVASMLDCPNDAATPCTVARNHSYLVDGAPQVRDAYIPTNSVSADLSELQSSANASRWMTMAVVGDRDGGSAFTALDITDTSSPKFLWEFPQATQIGSAATQRAEKAGRSWSDSFPNPAAIFPIKSGTGYRWVAALGGGFSRDHSAGRGIYLVDVKNGQIVWKFEYGASGENQYMRYSFAGALSGIVAKGGVPYFDQLVAADTGGQVWLFDLKQAVPTGQRIFVSSANTATSKAYAALPSPDGKVSLAEYPYHPMFMIPAIARDEEGSYWAYVGTGDRDLLANPTLLDPSGVTLDAAIPGLTCGNAPYNTRVYDNRFYALKLQRLDPSKPNTEDNLFDVTLAASGQEGVVGAANNPLAKDKAGWFLILRPAEKVNNPADVFNRVVYFTSYRPTGACNLDTSTTNACSVPTGEGRLYALNYLSGAPAVNFTNTDTGNTFGTASGSGAGGIQSGILSSADSSLLIDSGIPSAPSISVGIGNGRQSGATLVSTSSGGTPVSVAANTEDSLARLLYYLPVPKSLHDMLRQYGSQH